MSKLESLVSAYCDGRINEADLAELESLLKDSTEARKYLIEYMNVEAGLKEISDAKADLVMFPESKKTVIEKKNYWVYAAVVLLAINLLVFWLPENSIGAETVQVFDDNPVDEMTYSSNAVAQLTRIVDVDWGNAELTKVSKDLSPGQLKFESGLVQIEFFSGATMVLEGPAEIQVKSAMEVLCLSGKMHVKVPESAQGFIVDTGQMKVHDLGTEFAIDMKDDNREVHVLDGEVEIYHEGKKLKSLLKDDSVAWDEHEAELAEVASRSDFVTYRQIGKFGSSYTQKRQREWREHMAELSERDDVILLYDFDVEEDWQRSLTNKANFKTSEQKKYASTMEGGIIGASWSEGRWRGKKALDFKSINDRIRLNIPGTYKDVTMSAWVRIDSFDRWLSSLLLTDGFKSGALHWQLSDMGEMILGAKYSNAKKDYHDKAYNIFSPQVIQLDSLGQWVHVAFVYDSEAKKINQFLNGELIHSGDIKVPQMIELGDAEIGNWHTRAKGRDAIRSFNGRMDEFMIFSSALSYEEIQELYEKGLP